MKLLPWAIAALLPLASCEDPPPDLSVSNAWVRETVPGQTAAAVYLTIVNEGGSDRLVEAGTPAAASASLHASTSEGGVARMRPLSGGLEIPEAGQVTLRPGGNHIMLTGLGLILRQGESIILRLGFERSGERTVRVRIVDAAASGAEPPGHQGH